MDEFLWFTVGLVGLLIVGAVLVHLLGIWRELHKDD